ncbi:MAG: ergothioneine biosynthesis protein EgtB [Flavobacteriaceae bacterium]
MNLVQHFTEVRAYTEAICQPLTTEDHQVQAASFASPAKWHLAHTTWFFETFVLLPYMPGYEVFHSDFNFLFNSYYNHAGERVARTHRGSITRPGVQKVYEYRAYVNGAMSRFIKDTPEEEVCNLITLGIHHEQQHQELLLTDIKYMLWQNPLFPLYHADTRLLDNERNEKQGFVSVEAGVYDIGFQDTGFCYDNELGVHKVYLHDFEIDQGLITNGEYLEFINDGAYSNFDVWLDEGWSWVRENNIGAPLYWRFIDGEWHQFTLKGLQRVVPDEIVKHISFYEAAAFAEWKGMRLPTEFEWEVAAQKLHWGKRWEWTNSAYLPYPNFSRAKGAVGEYNGKFMINQMVLRGASIATSPNHGRKTYRNFFHPNYQWQFTGIRLVK